MTGDNNRNEKKRGRKKETETRRRRWYRCSRREEKKKVKRKWPLAIVRGTPWSSLCLLRDPLADQTNRSDRVRIRSRTWLGLACRWTVLVVFFFFFRFAASVIIAVNVHGSASRAVRFTTLRIPRIYDVPWKNDKKRGEKRERVSEGWKRTTGWY